MDHIDQLPSFAKLALALAKAQGSINPPAKKHKVDFLDKNGRRVKYSYADLADVIDCYRKPLSQNELAVLHQLDYSSKNIYGLTTTLIHSSGEQLSTWYPLPDPANQLLKPQDFGAALTYARRYSVSSLLGIASEEDSDGATDDDVTNKPSSEASKKPEPFKAPTPADFKMLIGAVGIKGKKLSELTEASLLLIQKGAQDKIKQVPAPKDIAQWVHIEFNVSQYLKSIQKDLPVLKDEPIDPPDKSENISQETDSADISINIDLDSVDVKNKPFRTIPEKDLIRARNEILNLMAKTPPPKNIAELFGAASDIKKFLNSMGVTV